MTKRNILAAILAAVLLSTTATAFVAGGSAAAAAAAAFVTRTPISSQRLYMGMAQVSVSLFAYHPTSE